MRLRQDTLSTSYKGSLLVALPTLLDPNFRRTILLLTHHDQEGAMGFILNRPSLRVLGEFIESQEDLSKTPVFEGGPVEQNNLILAGLRWNDHGVLFHSLGKEELSVGENAAIHDRAGIMAFTGYAGWIGGQLEKEIAENSWHLVPPSPSMLIPVETPEEGIQRWKEIMRGLGPWPHLLAQAPDDPSLN